MPSYTVAEIARLVKARVEGDSERTIERVAPLAEAGPHDIAFLDHAGARSDDGSGAGAILAAPGTNPGGGAAAILRVEDPRRAFLEVVRLFHPPPPTIAGIHRTAILGTGAILGEGVRIGPWVVVEAGARIGARTEVGPGCLIGEGVRLGTDCVLGHGVSILGQARLGDRVRVGPGSRLGTEGYGFVSTDSGATRVPQIGRLSIGDDVEIGANCTLDRGTLGETSIGARTKLDNLVHIGHNVRVGEDCMIVAQVGVAGSSRIGDGARLAGQAGIAGHLTVGAGARIAAQAGVIGDVPPGATWGGYPARPHRQMLRASALLLRLPRLFERLREIERRLGIGPDRGDP